MKYLKQTIRLIREKGWSYTYNRIFFIVFWMWIRKYPALISLYNWIHPYPSYIEVEVTTRCGLRCIMCEHSYWDEPARDMSYQEFVSILDQFPKLKWIGLTGIGESFLNKDFMKMLELVKSRGIFVELYDNLFYPDEEKIKALVDLQIDKLLISCEAGDAETYEQIRKGASFNVVKEHIKFLFAYKKEKQSQYPKISFHYIVMKNNLNNIPDYISFVADVVQGPAVIQISRMLHYFPEIRDLYTEISEEYIQMCNTLAKEHDIQISWNLDAQIDQPPISHCIEWTMPFIFVTGHVIPCCAANESNKREFQKNTAMGNIFETPFAEIWNGKRYTDLREQIRAGLCPPACTTCCLYNTKPPKRKN